jgi:hypothetical protein
MYSTACKEIYKFHVVFDYFFLSEMILAIAQAGL